MVSIKDVRISNSSLASEAPGTVALFVGATSGIGKGTLKAFAKHANTPKAYVVGRSKSSAAPLLKELQTLNPQGTFIFIESEVSLIKNVDKVCDEIKSNEPKLDILFVSPGYLTFAGRQESPEGIDISCALRYYARLRFVSNLLPLLTAASNPRVVSILAGGKESAIDLNDLEVRNNFSIRTAAGNCTTQTTLSFEELAKSYPSVSFCHAYPGLVNTGALHKFFDTASGLWALPAMLAKWMLLPIVNLFALTSDEAGERGLFVATSSRYPPSEPKGDVGVELPKGVQVAQSSVVKDGKGNGVYRLDQNGESVLDDSVLAGYRSKGAEKSVWENTEGVWERAISRA